MLFAAVGKAQSIKITGKLKVYAEKPKSLSLHSITGSDVVLEVQPNNTFTTELKLSAKGFYYLDSVGTLYLEPGYILNINPNPDGTYQFSGKGAAENNAFYSLGKLEANILTFAKNGKVRFETRSWPVNTFLDSVARYRAAVPKVLSVVKNPFFIQLTTQHSNAHLREMISKYRGLLIIDSAAFNKYSKFLDTANIYAKYYPSESFILKARVMRGKINEADIAKINAAKIGFEWNNELLFLNSQEYRAELSDSLERKEREQLAKKSSAFKDKKEKAEYLKLQDMDKPKALRQMNSADQFFTSKMIAAANKSLLFQGYLETIKNQQLLDSLYQTIDQSVLPTKLQEALVKRFNKHKKLIANTEPLDFNYPDINGKMVSLKDFRGKYVYIDCWATWCVPCQEEMPALKELEEQYKDKNIVFVSISLDKKSDKPNWEKFVKEKQLKGVQLMADKAFDSEFIQLFSIRSIPRFILIDPKGKIAFADARRPSDQQLKTELEKLL